MSYKYKNISDEALVIVGVGKAEPGEEIISNEKIENVHFQFIEQVNKPTEESANIVGVQAPQESVVTQPTPVEITETGGDE